VRTKARRWPAGIVAPKRATYAGPNCRTTAATVMAAHQARDYNAAIRAFTVRCSTSVTCGVMCV